MDTTENKQMYVFTITSQDKSVVTHKSQLCLKVSDLSMQFNKCMLKSIEFYVLKNKHKINNKKQQR